MKPEELMFDDWVFLPKCYEPGEDTGYAQVTQLDCELWTDALEQIDYDKAKPIPLTAEIMKKNGFVSVEEHRKHYTGNFDLSNYTHVMSWCENYFVAIAKVRDNCWNCHIQGDCANLDGGIDSVHHLQHALRTCEIGKIIVVWPTTAISMKLK